MGGWCNWQEKVTRQGSWSRMAGRRAARWLERYRVRVLSVQGGITRQIKLTAQAGIELELVSERGLILGVKSDKMGVAVAGGVVHS